MRIAVMMAVVFALAIQQSVHADLILGPTAPITHVVTVQPIVVSNDDDSNTSTFFGNATQRGTIESLIDSIWAQAGIDVDFLAPNAWSDSFANIGTAAPMARPTSDLNTIRSDAGVAGVNNLDPDVINMYFVEVVPGFTFTSENTANGLAFVGGNGVAQFVGSNLLTFTGGHEVIASVVAHEIGHNLGLVHLIEAENLMQEGGAPNPGERLNASQISTARSSRFAQAVPEPTSFGLVVLAIAGSTLRRRRSQQSAAQQSYR